jgi:hypothetical protein
MLCLTNHLIGLPWEKQKKSPPLCCAMAAIAATLRLARPARPEGFCPQVPEPVQAYGRSSWGKAIGKAIGNHRKMVID